MGNFVPQNGIATFILRECRIATLKTDVKGDTEPTYNPSVQIPGALTISIQPQGDAKELKGDSKTLEVFFVPNSTQVSFTGSETSLDALQVIMGGELTLSGSDPDQVASYTLFGENQQPPYFRLQGRFDGLGSNVAAGGNAIVTLWKCRATEMPKIEINDASGDPGQFTFSAAAVTTSSNDKVVSIDINQTAKDLE